MSYKYWCDRCGDEVQSQTLLEKHKNDCHEMFENFNCDVCSYETDKMIDLIDHRKFKHFIYDNKRVKCAHCGFGPTNKYTLDIHMSQKHEFVISCYLCDSIFHTPVDMEDDTNEQQKLHDDFIEHLKK